MSHVMVVRGIWCEMGGKKSRNPGAESIELPPQSRRLLNTTASESSNSPCGKIRFTDAVCQGFTSDNRNRPLCNMHIMREKVAFVNYGL
jgi:hypothetical protein